MDLQKVINNIKHFFNKNTSFLSHSKRKNNRNRLILSKIEQTSFIKKRNSYVIKNINLDVFKILWNNKNNYYIWFSLILFFLLIYVIAWPIFKVKNIEIIKQDNITNMLIAYKAVENFRWDSIFNIEKKEVLNRLKDYQHNIRDIKTNITLPNTIRIIIDSHKWIFNTTVNDKSFIITENGTFIPSSFSEELDKLKLITKWLNNKFIDYKRILDSKYINKIYKIKNSIEENLISIQLEELTYYITERELHIETTNNTTFIFDLNVEPNEQIEKISIFNKEHLNIEKNSIMYIDLRIKNKVFYCTTENEYQCIQNIKSIYSKE